jgi:hypothetical protein
MISEMLPRMFDATSAVRKRYEDIPEEFEWADNRIPLQGEIHTGELAPESFDMVAVNVLDRHTLLSSLQIVCVAHGARMKPVEAASDPTCAIVDIEKDGISFRALIKIEGKFISFVSPLPRRAGP